MERISETWFTEPVGLKDQPWFANQVAALAVDEERFTPESLLDALLEIENRMGRVREVRWGPRLIDLDLLLFGNRSIRSERLTLPHPRMCERAFVLAPLAQVGPGLILESGLSPARTLDGIRARITGRNIWQD